MGSGSTMPSGRSATRIPPGQPGDPMRADRRPAPGFPDGRKGGQRAIGVQQAGDPAPTNLLLSAGAPQPQPSPWANALLQTPIALPPAAMAQQPLAAPAEAVLPGQAVHSAVTKAMAPRYMSDDVLDRQLRRFLYIQNALRILLQQGIITHEHAVDLVRNAVADKAIPATEAGEILGSLTDDPSKLRAEFDHRHRISIHGAIALSGEKQKRDMAKSLEASKNLLAQSDEQTTPKALSATLGHLRTKAPALPSNASAADVRQALVEHIIAAHGTAGTGDA